MAPSARRNKQGPAKPLEEGDGQGERRRPSRQWTASVCRLLSFSCFFSAVAQPCGSLRFEPVMADRASPARFVKRFGYMFFSHSPDTTFYDRLDACCTKTTMDCVCYSKSTTYSVCPPTPTLPPLASFTRALSYHLLHTPHPFSCLSASPTLLTFPAPHPQSQPISSSLVASVDLPRLNYDDLCFVPLPSILIVPHPTHAMQYHAILYGEVQTS